jgi:hypothetical protein
LAGKRGDGSCLVRVTVGSRDAGWEGRRLGNEYSAAFPCADQSDAPPCRRHVMGGREETTPLLGPVAPGFQLPSSYSMACYLRALSIGCYECDGRGGATLRCLCPRLALSRPRFPTCARARRSRNRRPLVVRPFGSGVARYRRRVPAAWERSRDSWGWLAESGITALV